MSAWEGLNLERLDDTSLAEGRRLNNFIPRRKKKKLYPEDFVEVCDGFSAVDLCHYGCAGRLIAVLSEVYDLPQEVWSTRSLRVSDKGGLKIAHDLHCIICPEGWDLEPELARKD